MWTLSAKKRAFMMSEPVVKKWTQVSDNEIGFK